MAVTVVVLSSRPSSGTPASVPRPPPAEGPDLSLTLDAPRLVIGRSEGCDVRLPDPSVSHRHASIRQRGGEHVLLDENSTNGTFMDRVRLPPQTPRALRSGERVRLGRVWLEIRFEPAMVKGSTAAAAKDLALSLVARGLAAQGEDPSPRVTVVEGDGAGATLVLVEPGRSYTIGRAPGSDLQLEGEAVGRRHAVLSRRGDVVMVQASGGPGGTWLDGAELGPGEATWRAGQVLEIGRSRLAFAYPAAEALAELEGSPDERMPDGEVPEPEAAAPAGSDDATPPAPEATPTPAPAAGSRPVTRSRSATEPGSWGAVDSMVVIAALGVLVLSALGAFWLFGR